MILAAGRGERMRPLSDATPKPLLAAGGKPLIVWQIEALARAGFRDIVDQRRASAPTRSSTRSATARAAACASAGRASPSRSKPPAASPPRCRCLPPGPALIVSRRRLDALRLRVAARRAPTRWRAMPTGAARASRDGAEPALSSRRRFRARRRRVALRRRAAAHLRQHRRLRHRALFANFRAASKLKMLPLYQRWIAARPRLAASSTTALGPTSARPTISPRSTRTLTPAQRHDDRAHARNRTAADTMTPMTTIRCSIFPACRASTRSAPSM